MIQLMNINKNYKKNHLYPKNRDMRQWIHIALIEICRHKISYVLISKIHFAHLEKIVVKTNIAKYNFFFTQIVQNKNIPNHFCYLYHPKKNGPINIKLITAIFSFNLRYEYSTTIVETH